MYPTKQPPGGPVGCVGGFPAYTLSEAQTRCCAWKLGCEQKATTICCKTHLTPFPEVHPLPGALPQRRSAPWPDSLAVIDYYWFPIHSDSKSWGIAGFESQNQAQCIIPFPLGSPGGHNHAARTEGRAELPAVLLAQLVKTQKL